MLLLPMLSVPAFVKPGGVREVDITLDGQGAARLIVRPSRTLSVKVLLVPPMTVRVPCTSIGTLLVTLEIASFPVWVIVTPAGLLC